MTDLRYSVAALACVAVVSLLAGCAEPSGYYDQNGHYVLHNTPHNAKDHPQSFNSRKNTDYDYQPSHSAYDYDRRGYYNQNGYFVPTDSAHTVPENMFPPRGMCRVWFTERANMDQPAIESCDGIKSRVPAGAYVIYGG